MDVEQISATNREARHQRWSAWLADKCRECGCSPSEHRAAELAVIERWAVPVIAREMQVSRAAAEKALLDALRLLGGLPDFWKGARDFERNLLSCAANRSNYDERPDELRGVTPDRASDSLHGAKIVGFGDRRLRQDSLSAARLAMQKETFGA